MNYTELAEHVTTRLVAQIEAGAGTWSMPCHTVPGMFNAANASTSNRYRGANAIALGVEILDRGYSSRYFSTYRQWAALGAQVRKGEHGARVIKWVTPKAKDSTAKASEDEPRNGRQLVPKVYVVFNAAQVDGWTDPDQSPAEDIERDAAADVWIAATGAAITYGHNYAAYRPDADVIELPNPSQFHDTASLYSTSLHELTHWTGNPKRLNRDLSGRFGDDAYAAEELTAELGAAIACAGLHITPTARDDHAAYLAHWLRILNADPKALFAVAAEAQAAVDYLAGLQTDEAEK